MEVEVDAAKRTIVIGLAQDDRYMLIERESVAKMRPTLLVSVDGFFHQRLQRALAIVGNLVEAYDELVVSL